MTLEGHPAGSVARPAGPGLSSPESTAASSRWTILLLLSLAELLGMSLWFTASAVSPQLSERWALTPGQAGWLTTTVQLGFVAGTATAALLNLADVFPSRAYFSVSAVLAAGVNALLLVVPGYAPALGLRFLTGFFLAGVYPPAMKMISTWFRGGRGLAIGTVVGALTVGKAMPYLVNALTSVHYTLVITSTSAGALAAAGLVALFYREGPEPFERRAFSWGLVGEVVRHRETRLAVGGYLGHMWELYAVWTGASLFFLDYFTSGDVSPSGAAARAGLGAFGLIAAGGLGAVLAGWWADRLGRENITIASMAVSGACCLVMGWLLEAPVRAVVPLALLWGFAVVADSAQFSALVTEVGLKHAVGTALTLQTSLGFLLTAGTIALLIELEGRFGWGPAFSALAIGPALGILAMARLRRLRLQARAAGPAASSQRSRPSAAASE
jgi:MFS family permease